MHGRAGFTARAIRPPPQAWLWPCTQRKIRCRYTSSLRCIWSNVLHLQNVFVTSPLALPLVMSRISQEGRATSFVNDGPVSYFESKGLVINYGEGGATKWENRGSETFCAPPQDKVKLFAPPLLKSGNLTRPPYNMAKTSSSRIKTTPKLFVPPLQNG